MQCVLFVARVTAMASTATTMMTTAMTTIHKIMGQLFQRMVDCYNLLCKRAEKENPKMMMVVVMVKETWREWCSGGWEGGDEARDEMCSPTSMLRFPTE